MNHAPQQPLSHTRSQTLPPTSGPSAVHPAAARTTWRTSGKLTFGGVLGSERIKLFSLRSIRWAIAAMLVMSLGLSLLMSLIVALNVESGYPELLAQSGTLGITFTQLIVAVIGVLTITNEYSTGMIRSTLTAVPRRTPMLAAKGIIVALLGLVIGLISTFGGGLIGALIIPGTSPADLFVPGVFFSLLGGALYLALVALFSFGLGALLRASAAAISTSVGILFVLPLAFQMLSMAGWAWVPAVTNYLPSSLASTITSATLVGYDGDLSFGGAFLAMVVWALAALVPAGILLKTRDTV